MKHTPGPWSVGDGSAESMYAGSNIVQAHRPDSAALFNLADVNIHFEAEANARLIAAAPELLEALRQCMPQIHECASANCAADGHHECPYGLARAAIKKATEK